MSLGSRVRVCMCSVFNAKKVFKVQITSMGICVCGVDFMRVCVLEFYTWECNVKVG